MTEGNTISHTHPYFSTTNIMKIVEKEVPIDINCTLAKT